MKKSQKLIPTITFEGVSVSVDTSRSHMKSKEAFVKECGRCWTKDGKTDEKTGNVIASKEGEQMAAACWEMINKKEETQPAV